MINKGHLVEVYTIDGQIFRGTFLGPETYNSVDIISLRRSDDYPTIRSSSIEKIQILAQKKNGHLIGTAIGIVLDGLLIWRILKYESSWGF